MNPLHRLRSTIAPTCIAAALALGASGCIEHRVKTDPIHITVDVNVRVDEELKEFFAYERDIERRVLESDTPPETTP